MKHRLKTTIGVLALSLGFCFAGDAQNLILNPQLELGPVVTGGGQIANATNWTMGASFATAGLGAPTPDLFDRHSTTCGAPLGDINNLCVPINKWGTLNDFSGLNRYAGIWLNCIDEWSVKKYYDEHIQGQLTGYLSAGCYGLNFKIAGLSAALGNGSTNSLSNVEVLLTNAAGTSSIVVYTAPAPTIQVWHAYGTGITITPAQAGIYNRIEFRMRRNATAANQTIATAVYLDEFSLSAISSNAGLNKTICSGTGTTIGTAPDPLSGFIYSWSPGGMTTPVVSVSPTVTTTYTLTVSTPGGTCTSSSLVTVAVTPTPMVSVSNISVCTGTVIPASTTFGTAYTWTNSNPSIGLAASGTGNTPGFTATNATSKIIYATVSVTPSANGCTGIPVTYTIAVYPTPVVSVSNVTVCSGAFVPASTTFGPGFSWSNPYPTMGLPASGTGNTPGFTASNGTSRPTYTTVTVTPIANGCVGTAATYTVTVNPVPVVSIAGPSNSCSINTAILTASGATTYSWNTAAVTSAISVSPSATTTYTATGTNSSGCSSTATFTLNINPAVNLVVNGDFSSTTAPVGSSLNAYTIDCKPGEYLVAANFTNKCSSWPSIFDHTYGTAAGSMLLIDNGSYVDERVWSQTVNVTSGTVYTFSFWANCVYSPVTHPISLNMMVGTTLVAATGTVTPAQTWVKYTGTWTATASVPVVLSIIVPAASDIYRDFGIDDIFFGYCVDVCNPDFGVVSTLTSASSTTYTMVATPIINPSLYSGIGYYWDVVEVDATGAVVANSEVMNPNCWWLASGVNNFTGYNYATPYTSVNNSGIAFNGAAGACINTALGQFLTGHKYKITRGTWSNDCTWRQISATVSMSGTARSPLVIEKSEVSSVDSREADKIAMNKAKAEELTIYPNPSTGLFTLNMNNDEEKEVYVYDVMGKIVYMKKDTKEQSFVVDITGFTKGIYIVKVVSGNTVKTQRVINQ